MDTRVRLCLSFISLLISIHPTAFAAARTGAPPVGVGAEATQIDREIATVVGRMSRRADDILWRNQGLTTQLQAVIASISKIQSQRGTGYGALTEHLREMSNLLRELSGLSDQRIELTRDLIEFHRLRNTQSAGRRSAWLNVLKGYTNINRAKGPLSTFTAYGLSDEAYGLLERGVIPSA